MKRLKFPSSKLGITLVVLITSTMATWFFNFNAKNCLDRDFVENAYPAFCWRQVNDYESTIDFSWTLLQVLWVLTVVFSSLVISKKLIKNSASTPHGKRYAALFLASLSAVSFIFIATVVKVWASTEYNNNNYALNNAFSLVTRIGIPVWLALVTSAVTFSVSSRKK